MSTNGIPPISDYAHWNEDAALIWYEENKYDMAHPEVFEREYDDYAPDYGYDEYMDPDECAMDNDHYNATSGRTIEFAGVETYDAQMCDTCGIDLSCEWPKRA